LQGFDALSVRTLQFHLLIPYRFDP